MSLPIPLSASYVLTIGRKTMTFCQLAESPSDALPAIVLFANWQKVAHGNLRIALVNIISIRKRCLSVIIGKYETRNLIAYDWFHLFKWLWIPLFYRYLFLFLFSIFRVSIGLTDLVRWINRPTFSFWIANLLN